MKLRHAFAAACALALASAASLAETTPAAQSPEDAWKAEIADGNAAYSVNKLAILKIDDMVYLKTGEQAWLTRATDGVHKVVWSRTEVADAILAVANTGAGTTIVHGDKTQTVQTDPRFEYAIEEGIDMTLQTAQIDPGVDGVRVAAYNQDNPEAKAFTGLDYFPYDPAFVVTARFEPAATVEGVDFQTSRGWLKRFYRVGEAVFTLAGKEVRLPLYSGTEDKAKIDSLATFFHDETTGTLSYGAGRYLDVEIAVGSFPPAELTLDFNYAYSPNCARSPHYNCPLAIDTIPAAVLAGEKAPSTTH